MSEEKPTISIDQAELYNLASAMGLMCRAFADWDETIFASPHDVRVPGMMVAVFLLDRKLGGEFFKIAYMSFLDVLVERGILLGTPKETLWPAWDEESLNHPDLIPLFDLCILLAAWNFAAKQDEHPPEMFLGPLFTLSGVIVEGLERGYYLSDEKTRDMYQKQRESLASSHGSQEEFVAALSKQLSAISDALEERKGRIKKA